MDLTEKNNQMTVTIGVSDKNYDTLNAVAKEEERELQDLISEAVEYYCYALEGEKIVISPAALIECFKTFNDVGYTVEEMLENFEHFKKN